MCPASHPVSGAGEALAEEENQQKVIYSSFPRAAFRLAITLCLGKFVTSSVSRRSGDTKKSRHSFTATTPCMEKPSLGLTKNPRHSRI